jgi:hypothetical protein
VSQQGTVTRLSDRPLVCADVDALGAKAYVGGEVSMTAAETASRTLALAG